MALATGLTRERMLAIEASSIYYGLVDVNGNLILKNHAEESFNAGYVRGDKGDKGDKGDTGNTGDKGDKGDKGDQGATTMVADASQLSTGTLSNSRLTPGIWRDNGTVSSATDWNTLTTPGTYVVNSTAGANGPAGVYNWGVLTVSGSTTYVSHTYVTDTSPIQVYIRETWNNSFKAWSRLMLTDTAIADAQLPSRIQNAAQNIDLQNLFNYKNTGFYRGSSVTNAPDTGWWYFTVIRHDDTYVDYTAHEYFGTRIFRGRIEANVWKGWIEVTQSDTGWVDISSSLAFQTGFSFVADASDWGGLRARRIGNQTQLVLANIRLAANFFASIPTDGNITNTKVLTGVPSQFRPGTNNMGNLPGTAAGPMGAFYIDDLGQVWVGALAPGTSPTALHDYGLNGTFFN